MSATPTDNVRDSIQHYAELSLSDPNRFHDDIRRLIGGEAAAPTAGEIDEGPQQKQGKIVQP